MIDFDKWRAEKPHGISACIRVRNEAQFMTAAVMSVLPMVDEVVLVTQPSDDNTEGIANNLAEQHEKINVYHYPYIVDWIDTKGFYEKNPDEPGHLVHMSNWALSKCRYSWILKVEGDVIALPALEKMIKRVLNENQAIYAGLVILNVAGPKMDKISLQNPRNGGWDEAIFPNHPDLCRFHRSQKWEVAIPTTPRVSLGWALLHMKRCKIGKDYGWNGETYIEWTQANQERALEVYNAGSPYPAIDNLPLGLSVEMQKEVIREFVK